MNKSDKNFTPDGDAIRFGLCAIRNVGEAAVESIIAARDETARSHRSYDFCESVDRHVRQSAYDRMLIKAGAMDSLKGDAARSFLRSIDSAPWKAGSVRSGTS